MNKTQLYLKINEGLSLSQLAFHYNCSNSTIRYWMKKYNFKTSMAQNRGNLKKCLICESNLQGQQTKYCSGNCKAKAHYRKVTLKGNSYHRQSEKAVRRKLLFIKLSGGGCTSCGYNKNISALEFHHKDESVKDMRLDARSLGNHSLKILWLEFKKCLLLCSNCHREHHNPELNNLI